MADKQPQNLSSMKGAITGFLAARIELAAIEAKEATAVVSRKAVTAVVLGLCLFFAWALTLVALTGILTPFVSEIMVSDIDWLPNWAVVLIFFAILHLITATICLKKLKEKPAEELFELSRREIKNDQQWLKNQ